MTAPTLDRKTANINVKKLNSLGYNSVYGRHDELGQLKQQKSKSKSMIIMH